MLRVLLIYYEPIPAGQTTHVLSLASGLNRDHFRPIVVLPVDLQRSVAAFRRAGIEVVPLPLHKVVWHRQAVTTLVRLIREEEGTVVHVHSQEAGLVARVVARIAGTQAIVYTPQTVDIRRNRWRWLYVLTERALARVTDVIVSVNAADRGRLIRWGIPAHQIVTIPNGVDLSAFDGPVDVGELRRELRLDENRPLVMQVGRLSAQKDPLAFVEGALHVVQERPDAQFALVGDGPLRDAVAARVRALDLDEHVLILGWCDEARRLIAAADVVTLTSRWEGTPYALLEAMAWSRPVVATAVNGCPEIVEEGISGFLVPPGDTVAWARRVAGLLDDPARARAMGQRGKRRVEDQFSLREMIQRVESLYRQVALHSDVLQE